MSALRVDGHYIFVIETNSVVLTYDAIVKELDKNFVTFVDIKNNIRTFNLNKIVSIREVNKDDKPA